MSSHKVELTANILIILVAILLGAAVVRKYYIPSSDSHSQLPQIPSVGAKINVPSIDFSLRPKTLILVLQKGCRFCTQSADFYKRLVQLVQNKNNAQLVAVLPTPREVSDAYLRELGLYNIDVREAPLTAVHTSGTPTLILFNERGEVTHFWIGQLPVEKEIEVINQLSS